MNKTIFHAEEWLKPKRKTKGSAAYDFIAPHDVTVLADGQTDFDTQVSVEVEEGYVLLLVPRSSLGIFAGITLSNDVGVIDSDYRQNIRASLVNRRKEPYVIHKGERYMQGFIIPYFTTADDDATEERTGGLGSTGR